MGRDPLVLMKILRKIDAYVTHIRQVAAFYAMGKSKFWRCSKTLPLQNCIGYYSL